MAIGIAIKCRPKVFLMKWPLAQSFFEKLELSQLWQILLFSMTALAIWLSQLLHVLSVRGQQKPWWNTRKDQWNSRAVRCCIQSKGCCAAVLAAGVCWGNPTSDLLSLLQFIFHFGTENCRSECFDDSFRQRNNDAISSLHTLCISNFTIPFTLKPYW